MSTRYNTTAMICITTKKACSTTRPYITTSDRRVRTRLATIRIPRESNTKPAAMDLLHRTTTVNIITPRAKAAGMVEDTMDMVVAGIAGDKAEDMVEDKAEADTTAGESSRFRVLLSREVPP